MNIEDVPVYALAQRESVDNDNAGPFLVPGGLVDVIGGPPGQHNFAVFTSKALAEEFATAEGRNYLVPVAFRHQLEFLEVLKNLEADGVGWLFVNPRDGLSRYDKRLDLRQMLKGRPG